METDLRNVKLCCCEWVHTAMTCPACGSREYVWLSNLLERKTNTDRIRELLGKKE